MAVSECNARNLLLGLRPLREPVARPEGGEKGVDQSVGIQECGSRFLVRLSKHT